MAFDSSSDEEHGGTLVGWNRAVDGKLARQNSSDWQQKTMLPMVVHAKETVGNGRDRLPAAKAVGHS